MELRLRAVEDFTGLRPFRLMAHLRVLKYDLSEFGITTNRMGRTNFYELWMDSQSPSHLAKFSPCIWHPFSRPYTSHIIFYGSSSKSWINFLKTSNFLMVGNILTKHLRAIENSTGHRQSCEPSLLSFIKPTSLHSGLLS